MEFNTKTLPRAERNSSSMMGKQANKLEDKKHGVMES